MFDFLAVWRSAFRWLGAALFFATLPAAQADQTVYIDNPLDNTWQNWSWATVNLANGAPVHGGSTSISVSSTNWQALYLHHTFQRATNFTSLTFWINGGAGGQVVQVQATLNGIPQSAVALAPLPANSWRMESIPLTSLGTGTATNFDGFWIQVQNSGLAPTFYVDDITLLTGPEPPLIITVDAALNQHPISPLIYGVAFASPSDLTALNAPLNRSGGNAETRYNWELNAHNRGADWYFESLADSSSTPGAETDGFIGSTKGAGAEPIVTVPMIGWAPKLLPGRVRLSSYSISKYGPQTGNDFQYFADAGNGQGTNIALQTSWLITTNDPYDANFPTNSEFQAAWIRHLTNQWGLATNSGVRYYCMDNEHTLWNSTHRDVHPIGTMMQEIRDKFFDYGEKVKAIDPNALLLAPEEWGWTGYWYSGYDAQWAAAHNGDWDPSHMPDRTANGGWDYMPWFLDQARQHSIATGQRLLDYFTLHIYPQEGSQSGNDTSMATQLGRNRSTRALWDTSYVDQSWINNVVSLIPRMKSWVASYYPGTRIGITEYNWGAEGHINGATAQADILGIFGREGLDLATRWTTPGSSTPTFKAIRMYRNYDGNDSTFGETSISASGPNPDRVSCFAALRSTDGALTLMAINKQPGTNAPMNIVLTNFLSAGVARVWQLTAANTISHLADVAYTGNSFSNTLPAQSITLFVIPGGARPVLHALSAIDSSFNMQLDGVVGQRYAISATSDFVVWQPLQTNLLSSSSMEIAVPLTNSLRFYRAQWVP